MRERFDKKIRKLEFDSRGETQDNGDRRSGTDRRVFSYSLHIPERRDGEDRRKGKKWRKRPRVTIGKKSAISNGLKAPIGQ